VFPPGNAKDNWTIIVELANRIKKSLNYTNLDDVRKDLKKKYPIFSDLYEITKGEFVGIETLCKNNKKASDKKFINSISDFYLTNPISRSSKIMAQCSLKKNNRESIDG
jgi:NADH-quinone oxidoreductase subunit G